MLLNCEPGNTIYVKEYILLMYKVFLIRKYNNWHWFSGSSPES